MQIESKQMGHKHLFSFRTVENPSSKNIKKKKFNVLYTLCTRIVTIVIIFVECRSPSQERYFCSAQNLKQKIGHVAGPIILLTNMLGLFREFLFMRMIQNRMCFLARIVYFTTKATKMFFFTGYWKNLFPK